MLGGKRKLRKCSRIGGKGKDQPESTNKEMGGKMVHDQRGEHLRGMRTL